MTQKLTSSQLTELGHHFLACAQAVGNYRYEKKLTKEINRKLSDIQWTLLGFSDDFYTQSAVVMIHDSKESMTLVKQVVEHIKISYHKIRSVQRAIDLATAMVTLAAAMYSKSPAAVDAALNSLLKKQGIP